MKKVLLVLLVLFALAAAALAFFVITFDADRFRPQVVRAIEESTGLPAAMDKISLGWNGGPALELKGLVLSSGFGPSAGPLLELKSAYAVLNPSALWEKRIEISSILIQAPRIFIRPAGEGAAAAPASAPGGEREPAPAHPAGTAAESPGAGTGSPKGAPAAPLGFALLADEVRIRDGSVTLIAQEPGAETVSVDGIDVTLHDVGLDRPVRIEGRGAFLSRQPNLSLDGEVRYAVAERKLSVNSFRIETDLGSLDLDRLNRLLASPENPEPVLRQLEGRLSARLQPLTWTPGTPLPYSIQVLLENASVSLTALPSAVTALQGELLVTPEQANVSSLSGQLAGGKIALSGSISGLAEPEPVIQASLSAIGLRLQDIAAGSPEGVYPSGLLTVTFDGSVRGLEAREWENSLKGTGQVILKDGVIHNLNILREVFNGLSMIPTLVPRLQERLPPEYQEKLAQKDTYLSYVEMPVQVEGARVLAPRIQVASDVFAVAGTAAYFWPSERLILNMMLMMEPALSDAFIRSVEELRCFTDPQGGLQIPFGGEGPLKNFKLDIKKEELASRFVSCKAQQLIGGLFNRRQEQPAEAAGETQPAAQPAESSPKPVRKRPESARASDAEAIIGGLLDTFLGGQQTQSQSARQESGGS